MRTLRMKFATDAGKTFTVSLNYARDDLNALEVEEAMDAMLDEEMFAEALVGIAGAEVVERTVTTLF